MSRPSMVEGYPVFYLTSNGRVVCGEHASDKDSQHAHWEGAPIECEVDWDDCDTEIESAYGDPWADSEV